MIDPLTGCCPVHLQRGVWRLNAVHAAQFVCAACEDAQPEAPSPTQHEG